MSKKNKLKNSTIKPGLKNNKDFLSVKSISNYDTEKPVFSLQFLQTNFCVLNCTKDEKASFAECLRKLSNLSWFDIKRNHRHGLGFEKITKQSISAPIPLSIAENHDHFLAFRFHGKAPMVGFREQAVFHVLWLDSKFNLYRHS